MNAPKTAKPNGPTRDCWCGSSSFREFGPDYVECTTCGTLVSQKGLSSEELAVVDDESDFYGKKYWLDHQEQDLDYPDFKSRTRADLPERNLHWLRTLLKYRTPPARVIELGCAHGSFVAMLQQAGYQASGVEMSPWVVSFGKETFGIDVQVGPVERLDIAPGSIDVIAMMDVIEHLPDPVATMSHCLDLLKPNGILLIQMPDFQEGMRYEELVESGSPFLQQLKEDEHLYLYSKRATVEFFHRLGADHIAFEPAVFAHYDASFVVSRAPLRTNSQDEIESSLMTAKGRIAMALLDMKDRFDRAPVLQAEVAASSTILKELYERADSLANERNLAQAQLADLARNFSAVEKDRADRYDVIVEQGRRVSELEGEVHARLDELRELHVRLEASERDLANTNFHEVQRHIAAIEQDRADRLVVIQAQGARISELEEEVHRRLDELNRLFVQLEEARNDGNLAKAELANVQAQFEFVQGDRAERAKVIDAQGQRISELEGQVHLRLDELNRLYPELDVAKRAVDAAHDRLAANAGHASELEGLLASAGEEIERVQVALRQSSVEALRLQDLLVEQERQFMDKIVIRDAEMEALRKRWWWKLGSFFKAL